MCLLGVLRAGESPVPCRACRGTETPGDKTLLVSTARLWDQLLGTQPLWKGAFHPSGPEVQPLLPSTEAVCLLHLLLLLLGSCR